MDRIERADKYVDAWVKEQILIWEEKIREKGVVDTGALLASFHDNITATASGTTIAMKFLQYGIYQALGVGNGYKHDNGGDLYFLDKDYREEHKLGKPRERRDWYSRKLYMSVRAMVEDMARITGEEAANVLCENLTDIRSALS